MGRSAIFPASPEARPLFIAGIPQRSGTTAFANYLNLHPQILICIERYKYGPGRVTPDLFRFERILDYRRDETNIPRERHARLLEHKQAGRLRWLGDKRPNYFRHYTQLVADNPEAHFIVLFRPVEEVAESFQARERNGEDSWPHGFEDGVKRWNLALRRTRAFVESGADAQLLLLPYHDFFSGHEAGIALVARFLGVEFEPALRAQWAQRSAQFERRRRQKQPLSEGQTAFVAQNRDRDHERWALELVDRQYAAIG